MGSRDNRDGLQQESITGYVRHRKARIKRKLVYALLHIIVFLAQMASFLLPSCLVALWALPYAYAQRGYYAIGGEWLLIPAAGALGLYVFHRLVSKVLEV